MRFLLTIYSLSPNCHKRTNLQLLFQPTLLQKIDQCAAQLRDEGFDVFVPHEIPLPDPVTAKFIFAVDSKEVMAANAVLALLDGPMVDDGTATEIGIFWAAMQTDKTKKGIS